MDDSGYEFDYLSHIEDKILRYILNEYPKLHPEFAEHIEKEGYSAAEIAENINSDGLLSVMELYDKYRKVFDYFDDWILVKTNSDYTEIADVVVRERSDNHIETCDW